MAKSNKAVKRSLLAIASKHRRDVLDLMQRGFITQFEYESLRKACKELKCSMPDLEHVSIIEPSSKMQRAPERTKRNEPIQSMATLLLGQQLAPTYLSMSQEFNLDNIQVIIDSMSEAQGVREPNTPEQMYNLINLEQASSIVASAAGYMSAEEMHQHMENEYHEANS